MFDRTCHEVVGAPRLDGEPTREEQAALYAAAAGREVGDTRLHELFAAARYAAIVVRVMNRAVARGHVPPDHTVWLENPAATALAQIAGS
jgi:aminoglycoside phosphotransferase (APT) family kinase protein